MRANNRARVAIAVGILGLVLAMPQQSAAAVRKGTEFDVSRCAFGQGHELDGSKTGQSFIDRNAFYSVQFLTTFAPGGHFRIHGVYPHAREMSLQIYTSALTLEYGIEDRSIRPDRGSVNPFAPRTRYPSRGRAKYTLDILNVPPSAQKDPPPRNVLYAGYTPEGIPAAYENIMYRVYAAFPRYDRKGGVPLPKLYWVVDDPNTNLYQSASDVCTLQATKVQDTALKAAQELDQRLVTPLLAPTLNRIPFSVNNGQPVWTVRRRAAHHSGTFPWINAFNGVISTGFDSASQLQHKLLVIRIKTPTFTTTESGRLYSGKEQVRYWSWCATQLATPITYTNACRMDRQFALDRGRFATLVVSLPEDRPVIKGRPYRDWLATPGNGSVIVMRYLSANARTFPQSPYFLPPAFANDPFDFYPFHPALEAHMGAFYPQAKFCTRADFERDRCATTAPAGGSAPPIGASQQGTSGGSGVTLGGGLGLPGGIGVGR